MKASHWVRGKAYRHKICKLHRCPSRFQQLFQNLIISWETGHYPAAISPTPFCQIIVMPVLAFFTTELLISPSIPYLVPALKTYRHLFLFLFVFHLLYWLIFRDIPYRQISVQNNPRAIGPAWFFSFPRKIFLFFDHWHTAEKIFTSVKFILASSKKTIWSKKRKTLTGAP